MTRPTYHLPQEETLPRKALEQLQRRKLAAMLNDVRVNNAFYRRRLAGVDFDPLTDRIDKLPFTTRGQLESDQQDHPPYGSNLSYPLDQYTRMHQTSGTQGRPLRWLDTPQNWDWWKQCWGTIFAAAGLRKDDRLVFTFSFGPFIGFWGAFEAATSLGHLCLAAGGMSTSARLRYILDNAATVLFCTPTYALRMAQVAAEENIDIASSPIRAVIVAGEPGGHIPATRARIESAWGARLFDHTGMTEIGPLGFECLQDPFSVHLMENQCIAEVIDPQTSAPVPQGHTGELVITNLGRWGSPVIRYRTGDQVRLVYETCSCGRSMARMEGGILGRSDDMLIIRGNNVFPSAIEAIVRRFDEVVEFDIEVSQNGPLPEVIVRVELASISLDVPQRLAAALHDALAFRAQVQAVPPGTLEKQEMKARRFRRK